MNRRNLAKAFALLPFYSRIGWAQGTNPDPTKNIKLSSGAWLNVGEKWEVRNIGDFKSSTNKYIMGYFDRKFEIFVLFDKYTGSELQKQIQKMESKDGFLNGIVYNNGTDKFGLLGFYS